MGIRSHITDKRTNISAEVIKNHKTDKQALVVATFPYRTFENSIEFFASDEYGSNMNINPGATGTPEEVHNGIDDVLWTATYIVGGGKTTFNSTDRNHTIGGNNSIKVDKSPVGDVFQIAKGSDIDLNNYVSVTMWINVDKDWKNGDSVELYGWDTDANTQLGNVVELQDYFEFSDFDTWHKLTIPLIHMDLATETALDAIRVRQAAKEGKSPKYYIDDIQFEETGEPVEYYLKAEKGTWLHVEEFTISVADAYTGTVSDGTMPSIPYDKFLGESLVAGITYKREQDGKTKFSQTILNTIGFLQLAGVNLAGSGSDGTNSWMVLRVRHIEPIVLKPENDDKLSFSIAEDLSGLLHFRISAGCKIEEK